MNKNLAKGGFTLAEVLITLGVIGIVAAMTIPSLMAKYQKKVILNQIKETVAIFNTGFRQVLAEEGELSTNLDWATNNDALKTMLWSHFKIVRDCNSKYYPCFSEYLYYLNSNKGPIHQTFGCDQNFLLINGAAVCVDRLGNDENGDVLTIDVDVNGAKKPNILGYDIISFQISKEGTVVDRYFEQYGLRRNEVYNGALGQIMKDNWQITYKTK